MYGAGDTIRNRCWIRESSEFLKKKDGRFEEISSAPESLRKISYLFDKIDFAGSGREPPRKMRHER